MSGYYVFLLIGTVAVSLTGGMSIILGVYSCAGFRAKDFWFGAMCAWLAFIVALLCVASVGVLIAALRAAP